MPPEPIRSPWWLKGLEQIADSGELERSSFERSRTIRKPARTGQEGNEKAIGALVGAVMKTPAAPTEARSTASSTSAHRPLVHASQRRGSTTRETADGRFLLLCPGLIDRPDPERCVAGLSRLIRDLRGQATSFCRCDHPVNPRAGSQPSR